MQQGIRKVLATMPEVEVVGMCETSAQLERAIDGGGATSS